MTSWELLRKTLPIGDGSKESVKSFIGIVVAITGNIVISLALNCQKLAHRRLEEEFENNTPQRVVSPPASKSLSRHSSYSDHPPRDTTPLKPLRSSVARYSSAVSSPFKAKKRASNTGYVAVPGSADSDDESHTVPQSRVLGVIDLASNPPIGDVSIQEEEDEDELCNTERETESPSSGYDTPQRNNESAYLRSKLWWLGFVLMNIGEMGNFLSYAYAPASLVAPLGAFALIANCFFAPLMLHERFRKLDIVGLLLCIVGIVTIVIGGKNSDVRLDPDALIHAITRISFIVYSIICVVLASILAYLSNQPIGQRLVWIDLGLCALFGGYTVLCTKGISTLVSLQWIQIFKYWITYPLAVVLLATGVGQIRYLNRALMKFDSKVVIPTQFVLFNFTAILGSAVLYRDFESLPFERMVIFLYGCATTFIGVFVLARPNPPSDDSDDQQTNDQESEIDSPTLTVRGGISSGMGMQASGSNAFSQAMNSNPSGSIRLRPRASSSTIGLSPAKYLLLATGTSPPTTSMNMSPTASIPPPILAVPIVPRTQPYSQSTPQGSYVPNSRSAMDGSEIGMSSRSPSRDRSGSGAESVSTLRSPIKKRPRGGAVEESRF